LVALKRALKTATSGLASVGHTTTFFATSKKLVAPERALNAPTRGIASEVHTNMLRQGNFWWHFPNSFH
jgi:hypothetical protein